MFRKVNFFSSKKKKEKKKVEEKKVEKKPKTQKEEKKKALSPAQKVLTAEGWKRKQKSKEKTR